MRAFRTPKKCEVCHDEATTYIHRYDVYGKDNKKVSFCYDHKPPYDFEYIPRISDGYYKKFVHSHGTNYVQACNQQGEINAA